MLASFFELLPQAEQQGAHLLNPTLTLALALTLTLTLPLPPYP